jgi:hypothetical protein
MSSAGAVPGGSEHTNVGATESCAFGHLEWGRSAPLTGETEFLAGPRHYLADMLRVARIARLPILLMGTEYWADSIGFLRGTLLAKGAIRAEDLSRLVVTDDVEAVVQCQLSCARKRFGLAPARSSHAAS